MGLVEDSYGEVNRITENTGPHTERGGLGRGGEMGLGLIEGG